MTADGELLHLCFLCSSEGFSASAGRAHGKRSAEEETAGALQQTRRRGLQPVRTRSKPRRAGASRRLPVLLASSQPPRRSDFPTRCDSHTF